MNLVFFDLETGGLDRFRHPVIQFAAIAVELDSWQVLEEVEWKILFDEAEADPQALEANCYDRETWKRDGLARPVAMGSIADFFRRHADVEKISKAGKPYTIARLCGHNAARFDGDFLAEWFKSAGVFCPAGCYECLDTLQLARWRAITDPSFKPENFKLETLAAYLGIDPGSSHDALSDVRTTVELARWLMGRA